MFLLRQQAPLATKDVIFLISNNIRLFIATCALWICPLSKSRAYNLNWNIELYNRTFIHFQLGHTSAYNILNQDSAYRVWYLTFFDVNDNSCVTGNANFSANQLLDYKHNELCWDIPLWFILHQSPSDHSLLLEELYTHRPVCTLSAHKHITA